MNWKQGIRSRRQATGEEGVYEGRKQCRMLFICYRKQIGRATKNFLNELDHGDFTRLVYFHSHFFLTCS